MRVNCSMLKRKAHYEKAWYLQHTWMTSDLFNMLSVILVSKSLVTFLVLEKAFRGSDYLLLFLDRLLGHSVMTESIRTKTEPEKKNPCCNSASSCLSSSNAKRSLISILPRNKDAEHLESLIS